jgi:hypothetical protein
MNFNLEIEKMINKITIVWILLMFILVFLGIFFEQIYGFKVIDIVISLICIYFIYVFIEINILLIKNKFLTQNRNNYD